MVRKTISRSWLEVTNTYNRFAIATIQVLRKSSIFCQNRYIVLHLFKCFTSVLIYHIDIHSIDTHLSLRYFFVMQLKCELTLTGTFELRIILSFKISQIHLSKNHKGWEIRNCDSETIPVVIRHTQRIVVKIFFGLLLI